MAPSVPQLVAMRGFLRSTYLRGTLAGTDFTNHVVVLAEVSTPQGRALALQNPQAPASGDDNLIFLASHEGFVDVLGKIGVNRDLSQAYLAAPLALGSMRLVCVGQDIVTFQVVVAEGVS